MKYKNIQKFWGGVLRSYKKFFPEWSEILKNQPGKSNFGTKNNHAKTVLL